MVRYAHDAIGSPPVGIEPQPSTNVITVSDYSHEHVVVIRDAAQLAEAIGLLKDAGEILGWPKRKRKGWLRK